MHRRRLQIKLARAGQAGTRRTGLPTGVDDRDYYFRVPSRSPPSSPSAAKSGRRPARLLSNVSKWTAPGRDSQSLAQQTWVNEHETVSDREACDGAKHATADTLDASVLNDTAEMFGLLASPTRVHLLWLLAAEERDVNSLADAVGATVPAVSQHLAKLRLAGLVSSRRQGRQQIYLVDDPHVVTLIAQALDHHQNTGAS